MYQQHQLFQRGYVSMVVWSVHKAIHPWRAIARMLVWWLEDESNSHTKDSGGRMLKSIDGALGGYDDMVGWWLWNWRWLLCYFGSYQRHACPTFCIATNFKHPEHFIIPSTRFTSFSPCRPSALSKTHTLSLCLFHPMLDIVVHGSTLIRVDAHQQNQLGCQPHHQRHCKLRIIARDDHEEEANSSPNYELNEHCFWGLALCSVQGVFCGQAIPFCDNCEQLLNSINHCDAKCDKGEKEAFVKMSF